jgi:peptidoglycan/LPS O-acetylase OafA/YrhL
MFHRAYEIGYASNNGDNDHWLIQFPFLRLIPNGQTQVGTFFVLSGVSLSLRPLKLARAHSWDGFFDAMFSSVFRRALRLYLPILAVQSCVLVLTCLGAFNNAHRLRYAWPYGGTNEVMHVVFTSNWEQIEDWLKTMWAFANPFMFPNRPVYDIHLWTIPVEFRNSIILFATLVGLSKLRSRVRIILAVMLWGFSIACNQGETALFMAGMAIAEYILIREEAEDAMLPMTTLGDTQTRIRKSLRRVGWCVLCVFGLHLLSWPMSKSETSLGFATIDSMTPRFITTRSGDLWERLGATIFIFALSGCDLLRRPFETPFAIYLGKISFPLYIVHGPLNHMLGLSLVEMFRGVIGMETFVAYEVCVVLAFCFNAVVVVWVADIVMRLVDKPSVSLGRALQKRWSV